jgi:hypothetical protein
MGRGTLGMDSSSDLQGGEDGGGNRLLGKPVADARATLSRQRANPFPDVVFLCGEL